MRTNNTGNLWFDPNIRKSKQILLKNPHSQGQNNKN